MSDKKVLAFLPVYNEEGKIGVVLEKFPPGVVDAILVVDDGSTDGSAVEIAKFNTHVIRHEQKRGVGVGIREAIEFGIKNDFDILVVMAGNGKDDPREIPKLLTPLLNDGYDYVQGSRFLMGGAWTNLPLFRFVTIKLFTLAFNAVTRFNGTDVTNGFRAYCLSLFHDPRIDISQDWLGTYEMEYYIHHKVLKLGYRVVEVPVSKVYPQSRNARYSKIRPFVDWWKMMRPLVFLTLGLKK